MPQRQLDFKTIADVRTELDRLHQGGYEKLGQWDLAQVCDHLAYFIGGSLDGFTFRVPWLFKVLFGKLVLRRTLSQRRMKMGGFTPQNPLPSPGGDESAAVARLKELLDRFEAHLGDGGELHPSPFFGRLTPEHWRQLHLIHCGHHLGFLTARAEPRQGVMPSPARNLKMGGSHFPHCICRVCGKTGGDHWPHCVCPHCSVRGGRHSPRCACPLCTRMGGVHFSHCLCPGCGQIG